MKFTISEEANPFNFFDAIGFDYVEAVRESIENKFPLLSIKERELLFEENSDSIHEIIQEMKHSEAICDYHLEDIEVNEATGTWGYALYDVDDDLSIVRSRLKNEVIGLINPLLINS